MIATGGELNEPAFFHPLDAHGILLEQAHELLGARLVAGGLVQPSAVHLAALGAQHFEGRVNAVNIFAGSLGHGRGD